MQPSAIGASRNAATPQRRIIRVVAIGLAAALVLAYLGALGTGAAPFVERVVYWLAVILPGSVMGLVIAHAMKDVAFFANLPWARVVVTALAVSVPHTFLVVVVSAYFFGLSDMTAGLVVNFWIPVLVVALVLSAITFWSQEPFETTPSTSEVFDEAPARASPAAESPLPTVPALIAEKLPIGLSSGRLLAIEAEDHYLRVHTSLGSDLILMRMNDACALIPDGYGERVHRSWWVARAAVIGREKDGSRMTLNLENGKSASVSRAMQPLVRQEDWGSA